MNKENSLNVLFVPSDRQGVGHFRSIWPAQLLQKEYDDQINVDINYQPDFNDYEYLKQFDIVHFHRQLGDFEEHDKNFKILRDLGIKIVMDIDDYWEPFQGHPLHKLVKQEKIDKKIEETLPKVDWVTTTTEIFAQEIRKFNKNVKVIPNAVDPRNKMWASQDQKPEWDDRCRIGWIGGSCYDQETEILTENGFKFFKDLEENEKVATLDPKTNEIIYRKPDHYIKEKYQGNLICVENDVIDFAVTPNHNMYASLEEDNKFQLIQARDIYNKNFNIKKSVDKKEFINKNNIFKKYYNGYVYCVNVKDNIIFTRRNGKGMWCGNSHKDDLELMRNSFSMLHSDKSLKDKYQIILCGFDTRGSITEIDENGNQRTRDIKPHETVWVHFEKIFTDNYKLLSDDPEYEKWLHKIEKKNPSNVLEKNYVRRWTLPLTKYAKHYDYCDVVLAPLNHIDEVHTDKGQKIKKDNLFNRFKSEVKIMEAGMKNKVLIAQDYGIYNKLLKHGENSILIPTNKNDKEWYKAMKKVILDKDYREELSNNLHQMVKEKYDIRNVNKDRINFYKQIANK